MSITSSDDVVQCIRQYFLNEGGIWVDYKHETIWFNKNQVKRYEFKDMESIKSRFKVPRNATKLCMHMYWDGGTDGNPPDTIRITEDPRIYFVDKWDRSLSEPIIKFTESSTIDDLKQHLSKFIPKIMVIPPQNVPTTQPAASSDTVSQDLNQITDEILIEYVKKYIKEVGGISTDIPVETVHLPNQSGKPTQRHDITMTELLREKFIIPPYAVKIAMHLTWDYGYIDDGLQRTHLLKGAEICFLASDGTSLQEPIIEFDEKKNISKVYLALFGFLKLRTSATPSQPTHDQHFDLLMDIVEKVINELHTLRSEVERLRNSV